MVWVPARVLSISEKQLSFEVLSRSPSEGVPIGGPAFSTIPLELVPKMQAAVGLTFLLWLNSPHELASVEPLPAAISEVRDALAKVASFKGEPEEFTLHLSSELALDGEAAPADAAYAIITDAVLARGWFPDGVFDVPGGRLLAYAAL